MSRNPTQKARAWQHLMVAATNAALEQRVFELADLDEHERPLSLTWNFDLEGAPAIAQLVNAGAGEGGVAVATLRVAIDVRTEDADHWLRSLTSETKFPVQLRWWWGAAAAGLVLRHSGGEAMTVIIPGALGTLHARDTWLKRLTAGPLPKPNGFTVELGEARL